MDAKVKILLNQQELEFKMGGLSYGKKTKIQANDNQGKTQP